MDSKDITIISILSENPRIPHSRIGKEIKLSGDTVKNRIEKLFRTNIIKAFKININFAKLGYSEYDVYFRLKNYKQAELKGIIDYFVKNKYVTWVGTCFGKYDLRISLIIINNAELNNFIIEFQKNFSKYYDESQILYLINKYKVSQSMIIKNFFNVRNARVRNLAKEKLRNTLDNISEQAIILDGVEKKILKILDKDPTTSLVEVAKEMNISPEAIKYRLKELKTKNVITSFSTIINGNKLNKIWAVFLFRLDNINSDEIKRYINQTENISSFVHVMGNWNYSVSVFANNVEEIHHILMRFRNKFPDLIKDYELILLFETFKYPRLPAIIFE